MFMASLDANSEVNDETYGTEIESQKDQLHPHAVTALGNLWQRISFWAFNDFHQNILRKDPK